MAVHLEAKVGQFFTHQASESLLCSAHERCTVLSSARGATLQYQEIIQITMFLIHFFLVSFFGSSLNQAAGENCQNLCGKKEVGIINAIY